MEKKPIAKKKAISTYVTPQFRDEIQQLADKAQMPMSVYINLAIQTLITIQETGKIPQLTLHRLFREYPPEEPTEETVDYWAGVYPPMK